VATRHFKSGDFTQEEYERMDDLIGVDWVELSDDQLVGRLQKALEDLSGHTPSKAGFGDVPGMQEFFDHLVADLNRAIAEGTQAASKRDAEAVYNEPAQVGPATILPNSGAVIKADRGIRSFLDSAVGKSRAEVRDIVEAAKTGQTPSGALITEPVQKSKRTGASPMDSVKKALDLDKDLSDEQRAHVRAGQPLSWLLDPPAGIDETLVKAAASLYGAVNALAKRGGSIVLE